MTERDRPPEKGEGRRARPGTGHPARQNAKSTSANLARARRSGNGRVRGLAPWQPRAKSLALLEQVQAVLLEYEEHLPHDRWDAAAALRTEAEEAEVRADLLSRFGGSL